MLTITIHVASLIAFGTISYIAYDFRRKALNAQIKYESIKDFADKSAQTIMKLERANSEMASIINKLTADVVTKAESAVEEAAPTKKPFFRKRKRKPSTQA